MAVFGPVVEALVRPAAEAGRNLALRRAAGAELAGDCELAVAQNTLRLPAIINLINQLAEPVITPLSEAYTYPQLTLRPEADCKRYEILCSTEEVAA